MLPLALRKAAILIQALDARTADALLSQMGPEQAAKVRSALVELEEIPREEEQRVLEEFLQQQGSPALAKAMEASESDVELEVSDPPADKPSPPVDSPTHNTQFKSLASVEPDHLARALRAEQPQTIAAVIAQLAPEQTAGILESLSPELASESLERMATLEPLAPAVLADLERELQRRLAGQGATARGSDADRRLSAVIGAMDFRQRERVLRRLARRNAALVGRLGLSPETSDLGREGAYQASHFRYRLQRSEGSAEKAETQPPTLDFAELAQFDDDSLRAVFAAAEPAVVLLALTGADERLLSRVMRHLPARGAGILRERIEHPGPVRLREIDQAQRELAAIAGRLKREGAVRLPGGAPFAATA